MAGEGSWDHAIRLLAPDETGGVCVMGRMGQGSCARATVYLLSWTRMHPHSGQPSEYRWPCCPVHVAGFAKKHELEIPEPPARPVHVVVRRRDDEQQQRDLQAHILRELRALRREHAELAERFAGMFGLSSPSQRSLPMGEDAHDQRRRLWGDVRESAAG